MKYNGSTERDKFILSYEIKDNKIRVKLANKETITFPYSEGAKEAINQIMEGQIEKNFDDVYSSVSECLLNILAKYNLTGYALTIAMAAVLCFNKKIVDTTSIEVREDFLKNMEALIWTTSVLISSATLAIKNDTHESSDNKLRYFVANKEEIVKSFKAKGLTNITLSKKTLRKIKKGKLSIDDISINNADKYTLAELKEIRNNLEVKNTKESSNLDIAINEDGDKVYVLKRGSKN